MYQYSSEIRRPDDCKLPADLRAEQELRKSRKLSPAPNLKKIKGAKQGAEEQKTMSNIKATKKKPMSSTIATKEKPVFNPSIADGKSGIDILRDPNINKSTGFTETER
jgi:hypothetical protein